MIIRVFSPVGKRNRVLQWLFMSTRLQLKSIDQSGKLARLDAGWSNALSAVAIAKDVFEQRGIGIDQLPAVSPDLLPLNEAAEADRAAHVQQDIGHVATGVVEYTTDLLFHDLWLRPALEPRYRSLVTVSALIASGQVAQITYHLNRAMDNGLTQEEASETLTQLAFHVGWPNVFSALPVVKAAFEKRPR
jgi:4-carboxymuconolactone decarboxylase